MQEGDQSTGDLAFEMATDGKVRSLAEVVDDLDGEFIGGAPVAFAASLVPDIARALQAEGVPQVVVMHAQRNAAEGDRVETEERFAADARAWLAEAGIILVDIYGSDELDDSDFGGGDHIGAGAAR